MSSNQLGGLMTYTQAFGLVLVVLNGLIIPEAIKQQHDVVLAFGTIGVLCGLFLTFAKDK